MNHPALISVLPHIASRVYNTPLMIHPDKARAIEAVLAGHAEGNPPLVQAAEFREDRQGKPYRVTEGGTAVVSIYGTRDISNVVVTCPGGTPTHVETTDYTVDLVQGRLYIVPGGGIADDAAIEVDYGSAVRTIELVTSTNTGTKLGWFRYVADNTEGEKRDLLLPKVQMRPNGSFALKSRDTIQQMTFALSNSKRANYAQAYVNGQPV